MFPNNGENIVEYEKPYSSSCAPKPIYKQYVVGEKNGNITGT